MKKKIIIIILIVLIALGIVGIYSTFAINSTVSINGDNSYDIILSDNSTIEVPAKSSKIIYYQITNTNRCRVKYAVGYTSDSIEVKVYWDTPDSNTGFIDYGENKFIKLKLINNTSSDDTVTLSTIMGYENGGEVLASDSQMLVTREIKESNMLMDVNETQTKTSSFLRSSIEREKIASVTFVDDNIVPEGLTGVDVSLNNDGTVMMWYTSNNEDDTLYDIYIGSENGTTSLYSARQLFKFLTNVKKIDFSDNIDTSNVTDMHEMFYGCNNLIELDVTNFNTSRVTSMVSMFGCCYSLTYLDLSSFDTSNVTSMVCMFSSEFVSTLSELTPMSLTYINLSSFDTSNVTSMNCMFYGCSNLTTLDVSGFDIGNVTNMAYMFCYCNKLTLDCSKWIVNQDTINYYGFNFSAPGVTLPTLNTEIA